MTIKEQQKNFKNNFKYDYEKLKNLYLKNDGSIIYIIKEYKKTSFTFDIFYIKNNDLYNAIPFSLKKEIFTTDKRDNIKSNNLLRFHLNLGYILDVENPGLYQNYKELQ